MAPPTCNSSLLTTNNTNERGTENNGFFMNAKAEKQESNNTLSAIGSRHAPRNVFAFSKRAKKPSIKSVMHASVKKQNAIPQHALIMATTIIGTTIIRAIVKSVGMVIRFSAFGSLLKILSLNRERLIFFFICFI